MKNNKTFADNVRFMRENENIEKYDLAKLIGISKAKINKLEDGKGSVSSKTEKKLRLLFGAVNDDLFNVNLEEQCLRINDQMNTNAPENTESLNVSQPSAPQSQIDKYLPFWSLQNKKYVRYINCAAVVGILAVILSAFTAFGSRIVDFSGGKIQNLPFALCCIFVILAVEFVCCLYFIKLKQNPKTIMIKSGLSVKMC